MEKSVHTFAQSFPRIQKAIKFCRDAHESIKQVRKYSGEPYYTHPESVATILYLSGITDNDTLIAALLHDVIEDVYPKNLYFSVSTIESEFGCNVAKMVHEVTDYYTTQAFPQYNRTERMRQEARRLSYISLGAKLVKLGDIIHNTTGDIEKHDPAFAKIYRKEKEFVLSILLSDPAVFALKEKFSENARNLY